jgi:hypothetical protein
MAGLNMSEMMNGGGQSASMSSILAGMIGQQSGDDKSGLTSLLANGFPDISEMFEKALQYANYALRLIKVFKTHIKTIDIDRILLGITNVIDITLEELDKVAQSEDILSSQENKDSIVLVCDSLKSAKTQIQQNAEHIPSAISVMERGLESALSAMSSVP